MRRKVTQGGTMASIGLSEAAKLTGRNQSTIHRAMKAGRLSYTVDEAGERRIDTAELDRVFGIKANGASQEVLAQPLQSKVTHEGELAALQRLLDDREATIRDLRDQVADLRIQRDREGEERRALTARLLTDRRERSGWWRRIFERGS
jgi:hypothetical protein